MVYLLLIGEICPTSPTLNGTPGYAPELMGHISQKTNMNTPANVDGYSLLTLICTTTFVTFFYTATVTCSPNPCLNGGICQLHENSTSCICKNDYIGDQCEESKWQLLLKW